MEGLALTGAWVDREQGLVSTIVLEMGGSSDLCMKLSPGEPVVLMGRTGSPTEIETEETVVLAGGGLGNAVLFSIGQAFRAAGSKVLYFAGYKKMQDRYKVAEIEAAADVVIWCSDEAPGFAPQRQQDRAFVGNIVQAMRAYASGELGAQAINFSACDRIIAIGSDKMMAAVAFKRSFKQLQCKVDADRRTPAVDPLPNKHLRARASSCPLRYEGCLKSVMPSTQRKLIEPMNYAHTSYSGEGLQRQKVRVHASACGKFLVRSALDYRAAVEDQDTVSVLDCRQPVCDDESRPAPHEVLQRLHNKSFRFGIQGTCWLVQNEDGSVFEERARD